MEGYGLVYKGVPHARRPPPKKEFELSRRQRKHLEQEKETVDAYSLVHKVVLHALKPPPKKGLELIRLQGEAPGARAGAP